MIRLTENVNSPAGTERLAEGLSAFARPGLVILLEGQLGSGKSVFARAFIRSLAAAGITFDIPSPTFTLVQAYGETRIPVAHADLYRLQSPDEAEELGLEELSQSHVLLIEWPERLGARAFDNVLHVNLAGSGEARTITLEGHGDWEPILARNARIARFLDSAGWGSAERRFLEGDASFRRYETLTDAAGKRAILMDMPARPDGPPVRDGKPYSAIAHLAEDIRAVIAVNAQLSAMGYGAPSTSCADTAQGLAVIEDLGSNVYGRMRHAGADMRQPMRAAVEVLADMAGKAWPAKVPVDATTTHLVNAYDQSAQLIEVDLLPSWFWPFLHDRAVPSGVSDEFAAAWESVLPLTVAPSPVWVLRDFHSPNLLWLPERTGLLRVGLIDTQDCLLGHPAYDLASLLQDARVDIAPDEESELFEYYCELRGTFDRPAFESAYAILGAQRATKILGIFARLSKRDGKPGYLQHLPRVSRYLERNLRHSSLAPVSDWFQRHLPQAMRERCT